MSQTALKKPAALSLKDPSLFRQQCYINGKWVPSSGEGSLEVTNSATEEGIAYQGRLKANRGALLADLYPFAGTFRFTLGATSNQYKLNLDASGTGSTINVGGTNYVLGAGDGLAVEVKFPSTTPYVGLGWGHQEAGGFRFSFDLGASIGKAKVTVTPRGQLAQPAAQADVDRETQELRDGVGKIKALPQISFAIGFSF